MFLGHFAVAMAAKKVAPRPSLGTLVLAAQLADGLWPIFLLLGWERVAIEPGVTAVVPLLFISYPYTHSLAALVVWGVLFGAAYYAVRRDAKGAAWLAALVVSHWVLDVASHGPDVPLWPDGPKFGLGLWYSLPATLAVELGLYVAGVALFVSVSRASDRTGAMSFWAFVILLPVIYLGSVFGPPPPSVRVLAMTGLLGWIFVAWGYWIDRHRELRAT
jgi:membrane-bound metal-dependent hydrolase YbcI (DUF457 family)